MNYRIQDKSSQLKKLQALMGATKTKIDVDQTKPLSEQLRKLASFINVETKDHVLSLREILIQAGITAVFGLVVMQRSSLTSLRDVITITATAPALTWN